MWLVIKLNVTFLTREFCLWDMKTYCREINIEDSASIAPYILNCLDGNCRGRKKKWNIEKFKKTIYLYTSVTEEEYERAVSENDYNVLMRVVNELADYVSERIRKRELNLVPIRYFKHVDGLSQKERDISIESPMQQIMVYVAVGAMTPMLNAKIMPYQCASIKNRGQVFGKKAIEKWVRTDREAKYYAKADIKKCFPSIKRRVVMRLLKRDLHKNPTLLWFVDALLTTYAKNDDEVKRGESGLIIGSYLSQWMCNYALSYLYRHIDTMTKVRNSRHGPAKQIRLIRHVLFYMDDILVIGARAADVRSCMRQMVKWANDFLELTIKHGYEHVVKIENHMIDMMGFVVGYKHTRVRKRIFRRLRRQFVRAYRYLKHNHYLTLNRAQSVVSYAGFLNHTNCCEVGKRLHSQYVIAKAKESITIYSREINYSIGKGSPAIAA